MPKHTETEKHAEFTESQIDKAVLELSKTSEGKEFLWWLLTISKAVGVSPFSQNALTTAFACGEQNVGLQVLERLTTVTPDGYINIMKEKQNG